jgi:hypothetical protein
MELGRACLVGLSEARTRLVNLAPPLGMEDSVAAHVYAALAHEGDFLKNLAMLESLCRRII